MQLMQYATRPVIFPHQHNSPIYISFIDFDIFDAAFRPFRQKPRMFSITPGYKYYSL